MTLRFLETLQRAHAASPTAARHARFAGDATLRALRDRLLAVAGPALDRGLRLHVLVDPVLVDPLKTAAGRDQAIDVPLAAHADAPVRAPYLLALGDMGRDDRVDLALDLGFAEATRHPERETRGSTICAFVACPPADAARVAGALADVARRRAASRGQRLLRLWEPRVFEHLVPLLSGPALRELTADSAGWWWIGRDGALASRREAAGDTGRGWASSDVVDTLASIGAINGVLNALQDAAVASDRLPPTSTLLALLARARMQWGLADDFELIQFALYGVLVRADFDGDAEVRAAMAAARERGESCIDALASFDESHWEQRHDV